MYYGRLGDTRAVADRLAVLEERQRQRSKEAGRQRRASAESHRTVSEEKVMREAMSSHVTMPEITSDTLIASGTPQPIRHAARS